MNAEHLLAHYERIADAPDAIARLRRFILDLAVRGKLVPQDSSDEPASMLLRQIAVSKQRQLKARTIKQEVQLPTIGASEQPFNIPVNWEWIRLNDLTELVYGKLLPTSELLDEGYDVFGANGIIGKYSRYLYKDSMLLISCRGAYSGTPNISPPQCYVTNNSIVCEFFDPSSQDIRFIYSVLSISSRESVVTGTAQPQVTIANAIKLPLPLPPLAEQHRIVAKVDQLMALCDRLEAARAEREATRDRLAAATLGRLNTPDPATFQADARFALNTIPALTTRPDQIKQLRQTILNLAVSGKLVPQDPKDEPAVESLRQITKEKDRLLSGGKIRKEQPLSPIGSDDEPFAVPRSWRWSRLRSLVSTLGDGIHGTPSYSEKGECYFVNGNNLNNGKIIIKESTKTVSSEEMERHKKHLSSNSVLVSINGTLGNVAFYNGEKIILGKSACYLNLTDCTDKYYVKLVLQSPYFSNYASQSATGTTIMNLSLKAMNEFPFPLPPLAEQHRIVAKVDTLMKICDQLEGSLDQTATTRRRLLDALLAEALVPTSILNREEAA